MKNITFKHELGSIWYNDKFNQIYLVNGLSIEPEGSEIEIKIYHLKGLFFTASTIKEALDNSKYVGNMLE